MKLDARRLPKNNGKGYSAQSIARRNWSRWNPTLRVDRISTVRLNDSVSLDPLNQRLHKLEGRLPHRPALFCGIWKSAWVCGKTPAARSVQLTKHSPLGRRVLAVKNSTRDLVVQCSSTAFVSGQNTALRLPRQPRHIASATCELRPGGARYVTTGLVGRAVPCPPNVFGCIDCGASRTCGTRPTLTLRLSVSAGKRSRASKGADDRIPTPEAGSA